MSQGKAASLLTILRLFTFQTKPPRHGFLPQTQTGQTDGHAALRACYSPLCLSYLFQRKLPDFVVLRLTGFVFLLLLSSLLQKHKTCRPQSNKIKQFVLEKGSEAEGQGAGLVAAIIAPSLSLS